jgi:hypothetical protein
MITATGKEKVKVRVRYYSREEEENRVRFMAPAFNAMKRAERDRRAALGLPSFRALPDGEASALNAVYENELARIVYERRELARALAVECAVAAAAVEAGEDERALALVGQMKKTPGRVAALEALTAAAAQGVFFPAGVPALDVSLRGTVEGAAA